MVGSTQSQILHERLTKRHWEPWSWLSWGPWMGDVMRISTGGRCGGWLSGLSLGGQQYFWTKGAVGIISVGVSGGGGGRAWGVGQWESFLLLLLRVNRCDSTSVCWASWGETVERARHKCETDKGVQVCWGRHKTLGCGPGSNRHWQVTSLTIHPQPTPSPPQTPILQTYTNSFTNPLLGAWGQRTTSSIPPKCHHLIQSTSSSFKDNPDVLLTTDQLYRATRPREWCCSRVSSMLVHNPQKSRKWHGTEVLYYNRYTMIHI